MATKAGRWSPPARIGLLLGAAFVLVLSMPEPPATAAPKRVALTSTPGGRAAEVPVRVQIIRALKLNKLTVVALKAGTAPTDDGEWVAFGRKLKVDGFISLTFDETRAKQSVEVSVRTASDGSVVERETFSARGSPRNLVLLVQRGFWKKLGASVKQVSASRGVERTGMPARDLAHEPAAPREKQPAAATEPEDTPAPSAKAAANPHRGRVAVAEHHPEPAPPDAESESESEGARPGPAAAQPRPEPETVHASGGEKPTPAAIFISLQGRYMRRSFDYTPSAATPANSGASPSIGGDVTWFPTLRFGIEVGGEYQSWLKILDKYPSVESDLHASLVARLPLSFGNVYLRVGGFRQSYTVTDDGTATRQNLTFPDAVYVGARAGADVSVDLTPKLVLRVGADYRLVASITGGTYAITYRDYFPRAKAGPAFDGAVSLAYEVTKNLQLLIGGDIRRYMISTGSQVGDRINASDATDQYLGGWLGLAGTYGGR